MAEAIGYGLTPQLDIQQILMEAQHRWLRPAEICEILRNYEKFRIDTKPPNQPPSGSLFLFDRTVLRFFRKDGHNWRKRKDGKTIKEAHEKLKSGSVDVLHCYYAHGEVNTNFQRRSYWMLEEGFMHIVLVHYREVKDKKEMYGRGRESLDVEEFNQGGYVYSQVTSPATGADSRNSENASEFDGIDSDKSQANSRYYPFLHGLEKQFLMNSCQGGTYFSTLAQNIPGNQEIQVPPVPESEAYHVTYTNITNVHSGSGLDFTTFNGSGAQLISSEGVFGNHMGLQEAAVPAAISSASPLTVDIFRNLDGGVYPDVLSSQQTSMQSMAGWQDALQPDTSFLISHGTPSIETNPMIALLIKPRSLVLPNADGDKAIQKNDSFSRWASKELGGVVDDLNPKSRNYWDEVENISIGDDSYLSPEDHQSYVMSPPLSDNQLFSIVDIFPSWTFAKSEIMVFVCGSFLGNKHDVFKHKWSCMFGQEEVPAEIVTDGILRCFSPAGIFGRVPFCITCSNRSACSELREFEFRAYDEKKYDTFDPSILCTLEMLFYTRLDKMLPLGSLGHQEMMHSYSSEKVHVCNKISSLLLETNDELSLVLKKVADNNPVIDMNPIKKLMPILLKSKLHPWLLDKVLEGGKGPSILDKDGQGVIHLAAALGYNWAIAPLIAAGVNINFRDVRGWTALHWAAYWGRESTIVALLSLGAAPGLLTDPTPEFPSGRTPADLASRNGHKGIAGFLAESSLTTHLSALNLKEPGRSESAGVLVVSNVNSEETNTTELGGVDTEARLSLKDSLSAVCNAAQAAARIYQVYRLHSFHRKKIDEYGDDKFGMSNEHALSLISFKANRTPQHDEPANAAAMKIQKKFRGWKGRKNFIIMRKHVVKIQAHVRGYQVRKHFRKIVWSVGIVEKAILRWRRKGCGLRGFRPEGSTNGTSIQMQPVKENDYDFFREGQKQTEARLERALARVKSMVQYPEARDQYRRLLTGIEEFQESKVILERILNDEETIDACVMFDIDELIGDDVFMRAG